jgi:hypothetical protein
MVMRATKDYCLVSINHCRCEFASVDGRGSVTLWIPDYQPNRVHIDTYRYGGNVRTKRLTYDIRSMPKKWAWVW